MFEKQKKNNKKKQNKKNNNRNYSDTIIEIENDSFIHKLLNPGWDKEGLEIQKDKKKKSNK